MNKRIGVLVAGGVIAASLGFGSGGTASAAHCDTSGPGNSAFADHVRQRAHDEGFHRGWSSCIPGNPNEGFTRP